MKDLKILQYDSDFCIVIPQQETEFKPMVLKGDSLFDPNNKFRPLNPKKKQKSLNSSLQERALDIIETLSKTWVPEPTATPSEAPAPIPVPSTPQSTLDALIAKSVAEISVGSVMETAKPAIDAFIKQTYGLLPKVIEVKSPTGVSKVVGQTHYEFETILNLVNADIPVFLTGPAGCGKNVICKQVAEALNLDFYFSNAVTQEYKITGFIDANGHYHETQFYKAFTQGGVFMLDEMDASTPEVLIILNAAIANRYFDFPTGRVEAHKDFRIVSAGNTFGTGADAEYTGRFQLDAASLDRFAIIEVGYDKNIEKAIANNDELLLEFVYELRKSIKKSNINFSVSYRAIDRLTKLKEVLSIEKAIKIAIVRSLPEDDGKILANNMAKSDSNIYSAIFKSIFK